MRIIPKMCITIPCYNEENRFPFLEIEDALRNDWIYICFVNDGSTDKTLDILEKIKTHFPDRVSIISLNHNSGKAEAVRTGILSSLQTFRTELVGFLDADLATPFDEIKRFLEIADRFPAVKMFSGCRIRRLGAEIDRLWWRHYLGRMFATSASLSLGLPVYDTQCGAKIFRSQEVAHLFKDPFTSRWFFDIEIFARMIRDFGKEEATTRIMEIPLETWKDKSGSKLKFRTYFRALFDLLKIHLAYRRNRK